MNKSEQSYTHERQALLETTYRDDCDYSYYLELDGRLVIMSQMLEDEVAGNHDGCAGTDGRKIINLIDV